MTIIVMEVKQVEPHPNAETLTVYSMQAPGFDHLQIIANSENTYQLGERAVIALTGSVLKDGTKIKATKLRGLASYGMALGRTDEPVGSDLTERYGQNLDVSAVEMQKWPSIELLSNLNRSLQIAELAPQVTYRAKVKLDGTNAAVQVFLDGRIAAQSRTQVITTTSDNMGFANWVDQNQNFFCQLARPDHLTIFGEWCGKGIQSRTAVAQIDRKIFVVFALQIIGTKDKITRLEIDPDRIAALLLPHPDIYVLPFFGEPILLDFGNREQMQSAAAKLNALVEAVETIDPWVKETFGVEGMGEGLVLYPLAETQTERLGYSELLFKAKGEKHQVVKTKQPVQLDPELAKSIAEFASLFVTPNRLEQGLMQVCGGLADMRQMGPFLKWIATDVQKESVTELEAAHLSWKEVGKAVNEAARKWFSDKAQSL